jgi:hypothetical protein
MLTYADVCRKGCDGFALLIVVLATCTLLCHAKAFSSFSLQLQQLQQAAAAERVCGDSDTDRLLKKKRLLKAVPRLNPLPNDFFFFWLHRP